MAGMLTLRPGGGAEHYYLHPLFLRFQRYVDIDIVDAGMREKPHGIPGVEIIPFHDLHAITFHPLEKNKLVHAHLAGDPGKEGEGQLDHGMKTYKTSYPGIHFFYRQRSMAAAESVYPPPAFDRVRHQRGRRLYLFYLGVLDPLHYVPYIA